MKVKIDFSKWDMKQELEQWGNDKEYLKDIIIQNKDVEFNAERIDDLTYKVIANNEIDEISFFKHELIFI